MEDFSDDCLDNDYVSIINDGGDTTYFVIEEKNLIMSGNKIEDGSYFLKEEKISPTASIHVTEAGDCYFG